MSDQEIPSVPAASKPIKPVRIPRNSPPAPAVAASEEPPVAAEPERFAKIRVVRNGVKAKGFTFAAKAIVEGVPLVHAEYLKKSGEAEILAVS